jgi:hypothetical protein
MIIPSDWRTLLTKLQRTSFSEAVIAGGCLRDLDNDRPIKDIDIFVVSRGTETKNLLDAALGMTGAIASAEGPGPDSDTIDPLATVIEYVFDGAIALPTPIQVIVMDEDPTMRDPTEFMYKQLQRFDIGLCRIGFDGKHVYASDEYATDKKNQTITIVLEKNLKHSRARLQRIGQKYPGWRLLEDF